MSESSIAAFKARRAEQQDRLLNFAGKQMKRLLSIDNQVYLEGALSEKTKELLGLVASAVLRCDDCIFYHVDRCHTLGVTAAEFEEALTVAFAVGGTITIPHLRRAVQAWEELSLASQ